VVLNAETPFSDWRVYQNTLVNLEKLERWGTRATGRDTLTEFIWCSDRRRVVALETYQSRKEQLISITIGTGTSSQSSIQPREVNSPLEVRHLVSRRKTV
jgi:hypothetical protein